MSALRDRVSRSDGAMWRSLEEVAGTPEFRDVLAHEFPASIEDFEADGATRRNFLKLMGASLALAGLYGCSERPSGKIVPYVQQPEQIVPGMPLFFATAMPINGYGYGVLAESHEGRPTKIEGNPDHPASLGGTNIFMQASVLQLYDPDELRAKNVTRLGVVSSWENFAAELQNRLDFKRSSGGAGVRLLTGTITSPTLVWQIQQFLKQFPKARWHSYEPMARTNTQLGAMAAFGRPVNTVYQFRRKGDDGQPTDAKVVVSLDSDFLWSDPGSVRYSRDFIAARKIRVRHSWHTTMNRLYVIESSLSLTGSMADHRIPAGPDDIIAFTEALASMLGVEHTDRNIPVAWSKQLDAIVADLKANRGESIVIAGESQSPEVHRLAHAMNASLGNVGKTVLYTDPVEFVPTDANNKPTTAIESLRELTSDIVAGQVDTLLIFGENPAYTAPADLNFGQTLYAFAQQQGTKDRLEPFTAYLGMSSDETAYLCQWQLPEAHYLEAWGDVRAFDGTASVIQPLIAPIYQGRAPIEIMQMALSSRSNPSIMTGYEIVRSYWKQRVKGDLDAWWAKTLEKGVVENSAFHPIEAQPTGRGGPTTRPQPSSAEGQFQIVFRPDASVWDGRYANNGWLQECPKFFTKLVWDNAALLSPRTLEKLGGTAAESEMSNGDIYRFRSSDGLVIEAPIMVLPGLPDNVITMTFGYGRIRGGAATMEADGKTPRGFDAYKFRNSASPWIARGVSIESANRNHLLVVTHNHYAMDSLPGFGRKDLRGDLKPGVLEHPTDSETEEEEHEVNNRKLIRTTTLDYFNEKPEHRHFVKELGGEAEKRPLLSLYPGWDYSKGYQWGMSIDMQSCIGCNACLVACVAENNIAVVGREEVARQREMHWIRIDQYFADDLDNPKVYHQPVTCMQCENAPCELVCPVGATVHSPEGINDMVYNRCVGTRYCQNNCPYKVRRFNFFNWFHGTPEGYDLQHNPEVTVRSRGVMEKCTYCIQRIQRTRIELEKMIVRDEEQIAKLKSERESAKGEAAGELDRRITELTRQRHNTEFEKLEQLQTACQQACPTEAIVFGSLNPVRVVNEQGQTEMRITNVTKLKQEPLDYPLLAELTTKPRTTYMARLRNPNKDLEPGAKA
ncbi:MAG TPA: TAT-variant-translocated molybdopterin oxidoreductase [Tepidisphaeraceae bacterium]|nr:TAT-variant-translocated molybdopterin oxidoreductase [Tepidisphaeraceae bacterium]